jgi:WD40 repeat protein/tetratricopeptide (TPR) repeat protein
VSENALHSACRAPLHGPYPGLRSFQREEADIFFGRDEQIDELLERLGASRLLAVTGESGCGKSSLVRAGLIPALEAGFLADAHAHWRVAELLHPGEQPIQKLAAALLKTVTDKEPSEEETSIVAARLRRGPLGVSELLSERPVPEETELLILVDQFEELIRFRHNVGTDEADAFVALLLATVSTSLPIRIVLTMRTDYLGKCSIFLGLPEVLSRSQYLTPRLTRQQLEEAIRSPARAFAGDVEPALANHLINEVGRGQDQLPLIQHALMWMWSQAKSGPKRPENASTVTTLTLEDYTRIGGAGTALSAHADEVYRSLPAGQQDVAHRLFCALWDHKASEGDSRRPCRVEVAQAIVGNVALETFRNVADPFRAPAHCFLMPLASPEGAPLLPLETTDVLDVSHESLFRHWVKLKQWLKLEREDADTYLDLCRRATAWQAGRGDLLSRRDLCNQLAWDQRASPNSAWAARYGCTREDHETVRIFLSRSRRRRLFERVGLAALVLTFAAAVVLVKSELQRRANAQRLERLTSDASRAMILEPTRALQLTLESVASDALRPQLEGILRRAMRGTRFRSMLIASRDVFADAKLWDNGRRAITVGVGDGVAVWNVQTGERERASFGSEPRPSVLALTSETQFAATAGPSGAIDLWETGTGTLRRTFEGHWAGVNGLAFSRDGSVLVSVSDDGSARLWNTRTGSQEAALYDHLGPVTAVGFTHDGERFATAGADGRIVLWDARTRKKLLTLADERGASTKLSFNATGGLLAATRQSWIQFWDPINGREQGHVAHTARALDVDFSPDGRLIASVGKDGALRVWNARDQTPALEILEEPGLRLLSPRERIELSYGAGDHAGGLGSPKEAPIEASQALGGTGIDSLHGPSFQTVSFSQDGRKVITSGSDGSAKVWSVFANEELPAFRAHDGAVVRIVCGKDGATARFATSGDDGTLAIWETALGMPPRDGTTMREVLRTAAALRPIYALAFDPTGKWLAEGRSSHEPRLNSNELVKPSELALWSFQGEVPKQSEPAIVVPASDIDDVLFDSQSKRVLVAANQTIFAFDLARREKPLFKIEARASVYTIALSPDDGAIAGECESAGFGLGICLWDASSGNKELFLGKILTSISSLSFEPDGRSLISGTSDGLITRWNIASKTSEIIGRHGVAIDAIAVKPASHTMAGDDYLLATTSSASLRLWNLSRGTCVEGFPDVVPGARSLTFSPDGLTLVAGGRDGMVRAFALDGNDLVSAARARESFALSDADRTRYGGEFAEKPTSLQLANDHRLALRNAQALHGSDDPGLASGRVPLSDYARFEGAALVGKAFDAIGAPLERAIKKGAAIPASDPKKHEEFLSLLKVSVAESVQASIPLLERAKQQDPSLHFNVADFVDRRIADQLLYYARIVAADGTARAAEDFLQLVPNQDPGWAKRTANALPAFAVFAKVRESLDQGEMDSDVLRSLETLTKKPTDPDFVIWTRLAVQAYEAAGQEKNAADVARVVGPLVADPVVLAEFGAALVRLKDPNNARSILERALAVDPTSDEARIALGDAHEALGEHARAVEELLRVSPSSKAYVAAVESAANITFDQLHQEGNAYRLMAAVANGRDPNRWANLAESAFAVGRFLEARLIARRVIEQRDVDPIQPDAELAMRTILVCALVCSSDVAGAQHELHLLTEFVAHAKLTARAWNYNGSKVAAKRISDVAERHFVQAMFDYAEERGRPDPFALEHLLDQVAQARAASKTP